MRLGFSQHFEQLRTRHRLHHVSRADVFGFRAKHGIIESRKHNQPDIGVRVAPDHCELQTVERPEPHVSNQCVESRRLEHATRFLEAVVRDNVLAGIERLSGELARFAARLRNGDANAVKAWLEGAAQKRSKE